MTTTRPAPLSDTYTTRERVLEQPFSPADHRKMIEDVQFSKDLLVLFAEEPRWPSKISIADIQKEFPERSHSEIVFHLNCCCQAGLLDAAIRRVATSEAVSYQVGHVDGLTHKGSEFVLNAQNPTVFKRALDRCIQQAGHTSLALVAKVMNQIALEMVGLK